MGAVSARAAGSVDRLGGKLDAAITTRRVAARIGTHQERHRRERRVNLNRSGRPFYRAASFF